MDIQQAIVSVLENWRLRRDETKASVGSALVSSDASEKSKYDAWDRLVRPRADTKKAKVLSIFDLEALANHFGVGIETIIFEGRLLKEEEERRKRDNKN